MNNYVCLIVLMTLLSIVMGQQRFIGHRRKSKFRPRPEWFEEMHGALARPEPVIYEEQSDQPVPMYDPNNSPFHDLIMDDYEMPDSNPAEESGKFIRHININKAKPPPHFQNICPTNKMVVYVGNDSRFNPEYDYKPDLFIEYTCVHPYRRDSSYYQAPSHNQVCHGNFGGECIQLNSTLHFIRKLKDSRGENCWEPWPLNINSNCECMWSKHRNGDILKAHLSFDDE